MIDGVPKRFRTEAIVWRSICGALIVVAVALIFILPLIFQSRHFYQPRSGFIASCGPPSGTVGQDGWIVPDDLSMAVQTTLSRLFSDIDPSATAPLATWTDTTVSGNKYTAWGGEYTTIFMPLPVSFAKVVPNISHGDRSLRSDSQIALRVRYWTVRHDGVAAPGRVYFAIELLTRPGVEATDPAVHVAIADVLVTELTKETVP